MMATRTLVAALIASSGFACPAYAGEAREATESRLAAAPAAASAWTEGEVRRIDKEAGKVTIRHGPMLNLDMPAMTMVFRVKDPAMLDQIKAGDKIHFEAANVGGAYTVMKLEAAKR